MSIMMSMSPIMSSTPPPSPPSPLVSPSPSSSPTVLPVRSIPGSYGWPLFGPISDRLEYFWFQGPETFFKKRIDKYKSTVFRTNVPPSFPFFLNVNPNVVALLDCKSFAHLFDMDLVEKKNVLVGDFMPSVKFTGDLRVGAYLDTSEPQHAKVKKFAMDILKRSSNIWVSEVETNLDIMWDSVETSLSSSSSASYIVPLQKFIFTFLSKCLLGADPSTNSKIAESGYAMLDRWLALQLLPTVNIGILQPLEEIFFHSFAYPFFLVGGDYRNLSEFVEKEGKEVLKRGQTEFGLSKNETIHNLLFIMGFNAFGGFSVFLPSLVNRIGSDKGLQERLRKEVREKGGSTLSFDSVKQLELVQSVVYETLRLEPPVPLQYARARKDFKLSSHDSLYDIKKGELLCGFQKLVMKDPKVFDDPESFKPDRFTKEKGAELLNYLYWSNGPQAGSPSESNKQCAAKDYVTLTASLFVAHLFRRYDSITGSTSSITAVEKAK
ncbi:Allene oxide synthase, chloroplastic [Quillaja saponaria]|uniref:Allene oxide synthase, chloroplastic n=1 Tax=Quillaja saponaria TaxID=32244 RepID=A0AAD7QH55_QUISA|nr:Allene oxide synthase, chloroplastic [Quillaja saponaria]